MSDLEMLVDQLKREPWDRLLRLAYADALEEEGNLLEADIQRFLVEEITQWYDVSYSESVEEHEQCPLHHVIGTPAHGVFATDAEEANLICVDKRMTNGSLGAGLEWTDDAGWKWQVNYKGTGLLPEYRIYREHPLEWELIEQEIFNLDEARREARTLLSAIDDHRKMMIQGADGHKEILSP